MWSGELTGYWWLPGSKEEMCCGNLTVDPRDEIRLELYGSFGDFDEAAVSKEYDAILGISTDGKSLTLCDAHSAGHSISMPGIDQTAYIARYVISGGHFPDPADPGFDEMSLEFPYLVDWLGKSGFQLKLTQTKDMGLQRAQVAYEFPETEDASLGEDTISWDYRFTQSGDYSRRVELSQRTALKIELAEPKSFEELWDSYRFHLQNFLSLAIGEAIKPISVQVKSPAATREHEDEEKRKPLDVWVRADTGEIPETRKHQRQMLFSYDAVEEEFEQALQNWFEASDKLEPVYSHYFAVRQFPDLLLDHELLTLAQALEAYHRRKEGGTYVSEEEFTDIEEKLLESLPDDLDNAVFNAFRARLAYFNEYSLRKRLKLLWKRCEPIMEKFLVDKNEFVTKVVATRNYLTHLTEELEEKKITNVEMYWLAQGMKLFLEVQFLYELGFEEELINDLTDDHRPYSNVKKKLTSIFA